MLSINPAEEATPENSFEAFYSQSNLKAFWFSVGSTIYLSDYKKSLRAVLHAETKIIDV